MAQIKEQPKQEQTRYERRGPAKEAQRSEPSRRLSVKDILPIRNIEEGIISTRHHRAILIEVDGIDYNILDYAERNYLVEVLAHAIHDQQKSPFMWFYRAQRGSFAALRARLERRKQGEPNELLRNQFLPEMRYLSRLAADRGVVDRRSALVLTQPYRESVSVSTRSLSLLNRGSRQGASATATNVNKLWQSANWAAGTLNAMRIDAHVMNQEEVLTLLAGELGGRLDMGDWSSCVGELHIESDYVKLGRDRYRTIIYTTSRPHKTHPADLEPLVQIRDFDIAIACHFQPVNDDIARKSIRTNKTHLRAGRGMGREDMRVEFNEQSASEGEMMLAGQNARFFMSSLYVAVEGHSLAEMERNVGAVMELLRVMRLAPEVLRWGQDEGLAAMLPIAENLPAAHTTLPNIAEALSLEAVSQNTGCWMPNLISTYNHPSGVMLGTNGANGSTVIFDPWQVDAAAHTVVVATTGAGKTMAMIIECLRWMLRDPEIGYYFIDPQGGTEHFTTAVGGTFVRMGAGAIINPMDRRRAGGDPTPLDETISYLSGLFALMTELPSREYEAELATACEVLYDHFEKKIPTTLLIAEACANALRLYLPDRPDVLDQGKIKELVTLINQGWFGRERIKGKLRGIAGADADDYRLSVAARYIYTEHKPKIAAREEERGTPTMGDLLPYLIAAGAVRLANALGPFVSLRAHGKHYNGYTNVALSERLVSFSLFEVADTQRPIVMYMVMKFIWSQITQQTKRRVCVVDEFGLMMTQDPAVSKWVSNMYRRARFLGLRMVTIDQALRTFLEHPMGLYVLGNTSFFYILRQARSGANDDDLKNQFRLTQGQIMSRTNAGEGNVLIVEGNGSKVTEVQFSISAEQLIAFDTKPDQGSNLIHNRELGVSDEEPATNQAA